MRTVFISTSSFGEYDGGHALDLLRARGLKVICNDKKRTLTCDESRVVLRDVDYLIAGTEDLSAEVLSSAPRLKVISRCGVGLDNVDLQTAQRQGIKVVNTPDAVTDAVAELTMGVILDLLRQVARMDAELKQGVWKKRMGNLLAGKKAGIIGFGRIGKRVAKHLKDFGCDVSFCDPFVDENLSDIAKRTKEALLSWADIVTIHVSVNETLISKKELAMMKRGAWLVNMSRGKAVDEAALVEALSSGHLAGAALDVFDKEPYSGPLTQYANVVLTPHIGSYAKEARVNMERESVMNLLNVIKDI